MTDHEYSGKDSITKQDVNISISELERICREELDGASYASLQEKLDLLKQETRLESLLYVACAEYLIAANKTDVAIAALTVAKSLASSMPVWVKLALVYNKINLVDEVDWCISIVKGLVGHYDIIDLAYLSAMWAGLNRLDAFYQAFEDIEHLAKTANSMLRVAHVFMDFSEDKIAASCLERAEKIAENSKPVHEYDKTYLPVDGSALVSANDMLDLATTWIKFNNTNAVIRCLTKAENMPVSSRLLLDIADVWIDIKKVDDAARCVKSAEIKAGDFSDRELVIASWNHLGRREDVARCMKIAELKATSRDELEKLSRIWAYLGDNESADRLLSIAKSDISYLQDNDRKRPQKSKPLGNNGSGFVVKFLILVGIAFLVSLYYIGQPVVRLILRIILSEDAG